MKTIQGYIRDIPGGDGVPSIPVTIRHQVSGLTVASGGMTNCTTNPVNTDANGFFKWECELSPGPVKVDATISGSQKKVRSGLEMMQAGDVWVSEFGEYMKVLTSGVISAEGSDFSTSSAALNLTILPGAAIIEGRFFRLTTNRVIAVPSNAVYAVRWDLLVLQQYVGGASIGKQDIVLKTGTNGADPAINTDPDIYELPIYRARTSMGASVTNLDDLRAYSTILINNNQLGMAKLDAGGNLSTADTAKVIKAPTSGLTPVFASLSTLELNDVFTSSLANNDILVWDSTDSRFENRVHDHTATFSLIGHTHAHSALTGIDTDTGLSAIHHTLGTGANQSAAGNHTHSSGTPTAHQASHQSGGADALTGLVDANARSLYRVNGATIGTRRQFSVLGAGGTSVSGTDDAVNDRVSLTITGLDIGTTSVTAAAGNHNHNTTYSALAHEHSGYISRFDILTMGYIEHTATSTDTALATGSISLLAGVTYDIFMFAVAQGHMRAGVVGNAQLGVRWASEATQWGSQVGTEEGERPLVAMGNVAGIVGDGGSISYSIRGRTTNGGTGISEYFSGQMMVQAIPRGSN